MLITKLNLYNTEWLDVVFKNRNKSYGAYDLRKHNGTNMLKSLLITFSAVGVGIAFYSFMNNRGSGEISSVPIFNPEKDTMIVVPILPPPKEEEKVFEATPKTELPKVAPKAEKVKTTAIPTHVTNDEAKAVEPTPTDKIEGAIGPTNQDGPATAANIPAGTENGKEGGSGTNDGNGEGASNEPVGIAGLTSLPEPFDGMDGWNKYLSRNLRYPAIASEEGKSGRVFISFIIEKDGKLTDIKVEKGAGYGFDEEALRVLKKAKAWKPGTQNGRPVRVRYTIPISFTITNN
ncbi:energy transducer TonB [Mucilaginibacter sp. UR6-1]|uniref:energy transducer TonB n=1 Tax=Mucilaginibacter sp. UR6-1 TaxID=1435643 RepID=UPI001E587001|nr:energy transducer TonB [Mucilaginibacter sp. UR6-1]MCC8407489.1 energy transducer TonB [Mucilaginibacter sp. UR6-1]